MKLMWFHLMPYTGLPDDFRDKHNSVLVDIHSSLFDPARAHLMYDDFMDELEFAADCGFDAIRVNEHHSSGYGLMPRRYAGRIAEATSNSCDVCIIENAGHLVELDAPDAASRAIIDWTAVAAQKIAWMKDCRA